MQKPGLEKFRIEQVLKRKSDKFYVKWKGYDHCFNSWIDKKELEWNFINEIFEMKFIKLNFLNEILEANFFSMKFYKWNFLNQIFKRNLFNEILQMKSFWMKFVIINFLNEILSMKLFWWMKLWNFFEYVYVKWKRNDNRFNSWIDKKDLDWNFINEIFEMKFFKSNFLNEIL